MLIQVNYAGNEVRARFGHLVGRSVCSGGDNFDLQLGVAIALLKLSAEPNDDWPKTYLSRFGNFTLPQGVVPEYLDIKTRYEREVQAVKVVRRETGNMLLPLKCDITLKYGKLLLKRMQEGGFDAKLSPATF